MADGVDAAEDLLRHRVGQRRGVAQRVQDVQRQPADAEDRADPEGGGKGSSGFSLWICLERVILVFRLPAKDS